MSRDGLSRKFEPPIAPQLPEHAEACRWRESRYVSFRKIQFKSAHLSAVNP
jgi:hypothetical protein